MAFVGIAFVIFCVLAYPRSYSGRQTFLEPRENVGYLLSERFAHGHGFKYPLRHYQQLPADIARALTPRDAAEVDGAVVPKDFAGTMLLYGLLFMIWKPLVLIASPLFGVLSAFVLAKIGEELFDWRVGLAAFLLWLGYPVLIRDASLIFQSDTVLLFGMLSGVLYFCRYWRGHRRRDLVAMGVALGFSILMRYPTALAVAPLVLWLLLSKRMRWRESLVLAGTLFPAVVTILVFNRLTYGSFLVTGYGLGGRLISTTVNLSGHSLFQFHPDIASDYIKRYLVRWPIILGPQVVGLLSGAYIAWRAAAVRSMVLGLLASGMALVLYYVPTDAYGSASSTINASVLRYLLPMLALSTLFFVACLFLLTGRRIVVIGAVLVTILTIYGRTVWTAPDGIADTRAGVSRLQTFREHVLASTELDAIVASATMDKTLFPERQTLTVAYLLHNTRPIKGVGETIWYSFPSPDRFAEVAMQILKQDIPLYLLAPSDSDLALRYGVALRNVGLRLRHVWLVGKEFYKVVPVRARG